MLTFTLVGLSPTEHTSFSWTHFRTARFPGYGFKADISDGAFPSIAPLKLAPSVHRPISGLPPSFAPAESETLIPVLCREGTLLTTLSFGLQSPAFRATREHVPTSRSGRLYETPWLCGSA
jgi:hypothetical protein